MNPQAADIVSRFNLKPHPEGGFYTETYRSTMVLGEPDAGQRNVCTAILFLLTGNTFSAFHRICSDEIWHFYAGSGVTIYCIEPNGTYTETVVGNRFNQNEVPQFVVPAGVWFAARVVDGGSFAFVGCTVAPGFDFADFELANRRQLSAQYPQHSTIIDALTR